MSYIGNTPTTQSFTPAIDYFSGNGSTTAFTLTRPVASVAQVQVVVNNVAQNPNSAFSVSGNTITFTSAPSAGTSNIYVYYTSPITQVIQPSQGTIGKVQLDIASLNGTGALQLPTGTTGQRPTGATGLIRQNSTTSNPEWYDATTSSWLPFSQPITYSVNYLIVAGGASGGARIGGGGGAGGLLTSSVTLSGNTTYTITVGAGGASVTDSIGTGVAGNNGSNSSFSAVSTAAVGGGGGAAYTGIAAKSGGSGGGGTLGITAGGAGTSGQGNTGGTNAGGLSGAGGGGAGAVGNAESSNTGGAGGVGIASSITGSSVTYGGGGGGSGQSTGGAGGTGGGGAGAAGTSTPATSGSVNTGGGGGGVRDSADSGGFISGAGGSGVVILSIPTVNYTGTTTGSPTVTTSGANTILKYTSSGTYTA